MRSNHQFLLEHGIAEQKTMSRARRHQLIRFADWADSQEVDVHSATADILVQYAQFLREEYSLSESSVYAHLSTIRARLRELGITVSDTSDEQADAPSIQGTDTTGSHNDIGLDDILELATKAGLLDEAKLQQKWEQAEQAAEGQAKQILRLDTEQVNQLIHQPGVDTLQGLRDTALIAILLGTGIRESEVSRLEVNDLHHHLNDESALRIPKDDGSTDRLVPYGEMRVLSLTLTEIWLEAAEITEGPVFRGLYKSGKKLRPGRMDVRTVERILSNYPIRINSFDVSVSPLVLRRTYATHMYYSGIDISTLRDYLGLGSSDAVIEYIGLDRSPKKQSPTFIYGLPQYGDKGTTGEVEAGRNLREFVENLKKGLNKGQEQ